MPSASEAVDEPKHIEDERKQLLVRVPEGLHMLVGSLAKMEKTTMNQFVETAIVNEIKTNHREMARRFGSVFGAQIAVGEGLREIFDQMDDSEHHDQDGSGSMSATAGATS